MGYKPSFLILGTLALVLLLCSKPSAQDSAPSQAPPSTETLRLIEAEMCEDVTEGKPKNRGIAFSVGIGRVFCFSVFSVNQKTSIYHNWYYKEKLSTKTRFSLNPPRWSVFSTIQLREADKGPWRVEITDQKGRVLHILRFSIID